MVGSLPSENPGTTTAEKPHDLDFGLSLALLTSLHHAAMLSVLRTHYSQSHIDVMCVAVSLSCLVVVVVTAQRLRHGPMTFHKLDAESSRLDELRQLPASESE